MDFGTTVVELRKQKKSISQTDLTSRIGIHKNVLGRYERKEVLPYIAIARKIADILDVSLDYMTGKADVQMDKTTRDQILEVSIFEEDDRLHFFSEIDAFVAKQKIQRIL
ncbi:MAG: helix-turn-helix transcriptional regulator [Cryomorphaceae bacterium]|nr:helix-turn-helix transcriptional regulator [Cryomorphaceae bacterium]